MCFEMPFVSSVGIPVRKDTVAVRQDVLIFWNRGISWHKCRGVMH